MLHWFYIIFHVIRGRKGIKKNWDMQKKHKKTCLGAFFRQNIWSFRKFVVPLHAFSTEKELDRLDRLVELELLLTN